MGTISRFGITPHHDPNAGVQGRLEGVCFATSIFASLLTIGTRVIIPTVTSLQAAIRKYESIGGTASIFVNDDGMQAVSADLAE
jgi:hypothetical protein